MTSFCSVGNTRSRMDTKVRVRQVKALGHELDVLFLPFEVNAVEGHGLFTPCPGYPALCLRVNFMVIYSTSVK